MRLRNNLGAFTAFESLVGFLVFSLMLIIYLPGFRTELERMQAIREETVSWQMFYDLTRLSMGEFNNQVEISYLIEGAHEAILVFDCQIHRCQISFESGQEYEVEMLSIE